MPDVPPHPALGTCGPARERTYVVFRWRRNSWVGPAVEERTPLGTVDAASRSQAQVRACAAWPGESPHALRVRRAAACSPALLLGALAADGASRTA